jgi:formate hydrogenlyase transcriptional activator
MVNALFHFGELHRYKLESLDVLAYGGSSIAPALIRDYAGFCRRQRCCNPKGAAKPGQSEVLMGQNGYLPGRTSDGLPHVDCEGPLVRQVISLPYPFYDSNNPRPAINLIELSDINPDVHLDSDGASRSPFPALCHWSASRDEVLKAVSALLGNHHDVQGLFAALVVELRRLFNVDLIGISRQQAPSRTIEWHLYKSTGVIEFGSFGTTSDETFPEWLFQHDEPVIIPPLDRDIIPHTKIGELTRHGIQSLCAFPLACGERRIGSFLIGSKQLRVYTEGEVGLLSLIAEMIAPVIDDAVNVQAIRLTQAELQSKKDRWRLLLELNNRVVSNLEFRESLRAVSASVRRVMLCDAVAVHLPDDTTSQLQLFVLDLPAGDGSIKEDALLPMEDCSCRCHCEVFRSGKPILIEKAGAEICFPSSRCSSCAAINSEAIRSVCLLPLVIRDRVLGVLELIRRRDPGFTREDMDFMSQVANQIAIATENALAFRQIKELRNQLARENLYLEDELRSEHGFEEIIGRSASIRAVLRKIETVAPTDSTVLICGDTGTGKELVARAIHERSNRHANPLIKMNCAAIPTGLLESELFGHERGAFTGAIVQRIGRFELANRGTAFLDEIGEIALELQPKLLRVLQEREFERLGSTRTIKTDARLIAATNRDLAVCVEEKLFRADLFYRLNVFPIQVPPLRERPEDIPLLVRHFVQHYARRIGRNIDTIPSDTMDALVKYSWPGNIRELQNLVEHSVIVTSGPVLRVPIANLQSSNPRQSHRNKARTLEEAERELILETLKDTKWVQSGPRGAAARLGMNRSTLQFRMKKLGIIRPGA